MSKVTSVISRLFSEVENEFKVKGILFMTYRKESDVFEFYEVDENEEKVEKYLKRVPINRKHKVRQKNTPNDTQC